jgi:hypothetical protein
VNARMRTRMRLRKHRAVFGTTKSQCFFVCAVVLLAISLSGCSDPDARDERSAWKALTSWLDARTPPGTQIKVTKQTYRVLTSESVQIDFVLAASTGFEHEVAEMAALLGRDGKTWVVEDLYER